MSRSRVKRYRCRWCGALLRKDHVRDLPYRYCDVICQADDYEYERQQAKKADEIVGWFARLFTHKPAEPEAIPSEMFKKMLFLCHPDKHNNHPWAQEVTRWLLEQRRKANPGEVHTWEATERHV